ncbi:probable glutathione S-transferase [Impatiens glandulifera]|uniref:probable glutathione S-transferase n=1 Tax=Impatiens glandulifera TaxID=253017 RepID=UPI001FB0D5F4|nr:probable glutathione S-transferase [Impatiens glandulifera]
MAQKVVLLDLMASPFGALVRIGFAEKGVEYERMEEDLSNKSTLLLEMNPIHQKIPVLIHNGKPICESSVILEYIDEVWSGNSHLFPSDPYERAHTRFWIDYIGQNIYNKASAFAYKTTSVEMQEAAKKELVKCYKVLEEELGNKPYFGRESFNAIDITLIPFYTWFHSLEKLGLKIREECPKIVEWSERCMKRETVSKSLLSPESTYEVVLYLRNELLSGN